MSYYFSSDSHYFHANIIKYSQRPFSSVEKMNETLITNWNSRVKPTDTAYHLGDFGFGRPEQLKQILRRLNGQKYLIFGNHDKQLRKEKELLGYFGWAKDYAEINIDHQKIILSHYSFRVWNQSHRGSWNLFGHSHGSLYDDPHLLSMDVGVDCHNYFPISFEEVRKHMSSKEWKESMMKSGDG